jgi:hypothetical protein
MLRLTPNRTHSQDWLLPLLLMVIWCLLAPVVFAGTGSTGNGHTGSGHTGSGTAAVGPADTREYTVDGSLNARGPRALETGTPAARSGGQAARETPGPSGLRILGVRPVTGDCQARMEIRLDRERHVEVELVSQDGRVLSRQVAGLLSRGTHGLQLPRVGVWGQVLTARLLSEGESHSLKLLMIE